MHGAPDHVPHASLAHRREPALAWREEVDRGVPCGGAHQGRACAREVGRSEGHQVVEEGVRGEVAVSSGREEPAWSVLDDAYNYNNLRINVTDLYCALHRKLCSSVAISLYCPRPCTRCHRTARPTQQNIDFSTRLLHLEVTKSGEWQTVPINEDARQVLVRRIRLRDEICPDTQWVFFHVVPALNTKVGDRVKNVRKAFSTACRRAGIGNFHIHDLRHTFASWLVMEGVPLFEVSKLLRHASIQMTERYAHLAPDHLHDAVASIKFSAHDKFGAERGQ